VLEESRFVFQDIYHDIRSADNSDNLSMIEYRYSSEIIIYKAFADVKEAIVMVEAYHFFGHEGRVAQL